jgi:histidinol dehydrogenase
LLTQRSALGGPEVRAQVRAIVIAVREGGDAALREANARYGGGLLAPIGGVAPLVIEPAALRAARDALPRALRAGLERILANLTSFHAAQVPPAEQWVEVAPGIHVGRVWRPIDRVAAYVPGGEAAYPSSLLMCVVPARLAGTREVVVVSPAARDGTVSPAVLGAAGLVGVEALYVAGGAQAVAALAYGTEMIAPVDKIVGPGNAWVTAAKLEVFGDVAIDLPAGPSEVLVLADETADPTYVAADLLSQAEHGRDSAAVLVTPSPTLADAVEAAIAAQLPGLERATFLRASLATAGLIVEARDRADAVDFVNDYAPEHLSVVLVDDDVAVAAIRHAGSVFVGPWAPESAGDYATGSNHVLPTGRLARAFGALSVETFGKWMQVQRLTRDGLGSIRETVAVVAEAEGLSAHRRAVEVRFEAGEAPA